MMCDIRSHHFSACLCLCPRYQAQSPHSWVLLSLGPSSTSSSVSSPQVSAGFHFFDNNNLSVSKTLQTHLPILKNHSNRQKPALSHARRRFPRLAALRRARRPQPSPCRRTRSQPRPSEALHQRDQARRASSELRRSPNQTPNLRRAEDRVETEV